MLPPPTIHTLYFFIFISPFLSFQMANFFTNSIYTHNIIHNFVNVNVFAAVRFICVITIFITNQVILYICFIYSVYSTCKRFYSESINFIDLSVSQKNLCTITYLYCSHINFIAIAIKQKSINIKQKSFTYNLNFKL